MAGLHEGARNAPCLRALPDANVWLDAAFCPDSIARRAITALRVANTSLLLSGSIEEEACRVLRALRLALGLSFDPIQHFVAYTASVGALAVPASDPGITVTPVNRADAHVARTAVEHNALLVTGDAPLIAQCQRANVVAEFPWSVLVRAGGTHPVDEILRIVSPTARTGTIFARATPGGWNGSRDVGTFTVVDLEHIGNIVRKGVNGVLSFGDEAPVVR
jgi:predicted nucleic acid-binding protein